MYQSFYFSAFQERVVCCGPHTGQGIAFTVHQPWPLLARCGAYADVNLRSSMHDHNICIFGQWCHHPSLTFIFNILAELAHARAVLLAGSKGEKAQAALQETRNCSSSRA